MKATLSDDTVSVLPEPSAESLSIATMHKGDEFELGKVVRKKKDAWVYVTLVNGTTGYISGTTRIFAIQKVEAIANPLDVHETPDEESPVLKTIPKKTTFTVRGVEKVEEKEWFVMQDDEIERGYILSGPKLRVVPEITKSSARKTMITGGIFAAAGTVIYFFTQPQAVSGGSADFSLLALVLILLGLFQLIQGYMQWRKAPEDKDKK